jgi:hypothetical protein
LLKRVGIFFSYGREASLSKEVFTLLLRARKEGAI